MGMRSRRKGKVGELELAKVLQRLLGIECRRGQQYNGLEGQDVVGVPGIHVECKRVERFSLYSSLAQAKEDSAPDDIPIVCHRQNQKEWVLVCYLEDLPELAKRIQFWRVK